MKDDLNMGTFSEEPSNGSGQNLAASLEELLAGRRPADAGQAAGAEAVACPDLAAWLRLLRGEATPEETGRLLTHASACAVCAEGLRADLAEPMPQAFELNGLACMNAEWQRALAERLARTPVVAPLQIRPGRPKRLTLWAGAALAAALVLAVGAVAWWNYANTPERLMAEAYSRDRIFELRMPGAAFADVNPKVHLRGSASGRESAPLLDAKARIERNLEASPDDPHWQQMEARADVLEEKFGAAIDILDRLVAAGPVTPGLLADDAAAYFQRGAATGSENDRSTALEYLRRADELAPGDPVVLFNEAVAMEDRGQLMNAVETWNRYLRFERDPKWLAEGRRRLQRLEEKLNKLKTHASRLDGHLATPAAMGALAADPAALGSIDEELSASYLPRIVDSAFSMPVDRSRGSPCDNGCQSARSLLYALAASLQQNHQDSWLTQLLPSAPSSPDPNFIQAVQTLMQAVGADRQGDFLAGQQKSAAAAAQFHALRNAAGEDRAQVERAYALERSSDIPGCFREAHAVAQRDPQFVWVHIYALTQEHECDPAPGQSPEHDPVYMRIAAIAQEHRYTIQGMRVRNLLASPAVDAGDSEAAWRIYEPIVTDFYAGDYPAVRLYAALSGMAEVEGYTPRVRHALLLQRETVHALELTPLKNLVPTERFKLATAAIRAGAIPEAQEQMRLAQQELKATGGEKSVQGFLAENELLMARVYLDRGDLAAAGKVLDQAAAHMASTHNLLHERNYAVARGELELASGHIEAAEPLLRNVLLFEESITGKGGAENISRAQQNRELYAVLAGLWLAQGRSGEDVLALWERYRLRILGISLPPCPDKSFTCMKPQLTAALSALGEDRLLGQVVLFDRMLLYTATARGVTWREAPLRRDDVMGVAEPLERAVSSPVTPIRVVEAAARRAGNVFLAQLDAAGPPASGQHLLLEPDPALGNFPWPAVETEAGPLGLRFNLEESPSLLLDGAADAARTGGKPLIVGASIAGPDRAPLPEVMEEARAVARLSVGATLLLGEQAGQAQVSARLATASAIHFAGHAEQQEGATRLLLAEGKRESAPQTPPGGHWLDSELLRRFPPRVARLVVFSACASGRNEAGWNHGMDDLVATLGGIGVPQVVATRWQIDSQAAVPMMDAFYGGLAHGLDVPQALTAARQTLVRDQRYRHPYYWAAWYASGTERGSGGGSAPGGPGLTAMFRAER